MYMHVYDLVFVLITIITTGPWQMGQVRAGNLVAQIKSFTYSPKNNFGNVKLIQQLTLIFLFGIMIPL